MSGATAEMSFDALGRLGEEAATLEPRQKLTVVQWAERYRKLDQKTSAIPGRFSWDYVPFLVEIAECLSDPEIRRVTGKKCSQAGWTELTNNVIGWAVDESPSPLMVVMPTEATVNRRVETRLRPMFVTSRSLLRHLGGDIDRLNIGKETDLDNMILYLAWASSPIALSDAPVCIVILDEVDKYPDRAGKEADPVSLAEKRQRTFLFAKTLEGSTPTDQFGRIGIDFNAGDRRKWWVKCTHCGEHHILRWGNVVLDKGQDGHLLSSAEYAAGGRARYVCPACGVEWTEAERWRAVCGGKWAPGGCKVDKAGRLVGDVAKTNHRSYHISAMMLYPGFMSVDRLAAAWAFAIRQQAAGDMGPMIDFVNSELGEVWTEAEAATDKDKLRTHIEKYAGTVEQAAGRRGVEVGLPAGIVRLTAGIDVQLDHFYVTVWGWGFGFEGWLIDFQRLETEIVGDGPTAAMEFAPVEEMLRRTWRRIDETDETMEISLAFVDSQYRTEQVYEFCRGFTSGDCWPARGDDSLRDVNLKPSKLETSSSARKRKILQAGHLQLWRLSTYMLKTKLARLSNTRDPGPGYLHLPANVSDEFLKQFTAEHLKVERRRNRYGKMEISRLWTMKPNARANHYWDCSYMALAAAIRRGVHNIRDPKAPPPTIGRAAGRRYERKERFE